MKVSVCITAYNNEKYIVQALESVLSQSTTFDIEIIIGEDDSSDNTRNIVRGYKEKYPNIIKLLLNDRSNVIYIDGKPTGIWNLVNVMNHAQGEYLALLDGDDYWLTDDKLQKQVDFLDENSECSICFHNALEYLEEEGITRIFLPADFPRITTLEKLLDYNFIPTCTVMYRKSSIPSLPHWFTQLRMSDWPLHVLAATRGSIGYIDSVMGCYRQHNQGSWYSLPLAQKYLYILKAYKVLQQHFNFDDFYRNKIKNLRYRHYLLVSEEYSKSRKYLKAIKYKLIANIVRYYNNLFLRL